MRQPWRGVATGSLGACLRVPGWRPARTTPGRLKDVVTDINRSLNVEQFCKDLPSRVSQLIEAEGGRLPK